MYATESLSSVFVSHGASDILLSESPAMDTMENLARRFPDPRAIVVVSAHWTDNPVGVTTGGQLSTIHDFGGFPEALYEIEYPAVGNDELSADIVRRLGEMGLGNRIAKRRGLDHGAWIPLKIMYPAAQVPVVQVSLPTGSFDKLVRLGAALRPLREKGVFVMGSGGSVHNLRALRHSGPADDWVIQFEQWLLAAVEGNQFERLITPSGFPAIFSQAHPSLEHYAPLVVAWAAGDPDQPGRRIHHSFTYGNLGMSCFEFGNRMV